jgi:uncharacterized protein (DUF1800 family)
MAKRKSRFKPILFLIALCLSTAPLSALRAAPTEATDEQILHVLNRLSFGPAPGDVEAVRRIGIDTYIEQQLHPSLLPRSPELDTRLADLSTLNESTTQLAEKYEPSKEEAQSASEEQKKEFAKRRNIVLEELSEAKILRGVMSPAQLQEVMTDFWFNHFNVFAEKGYDKTFISPYEREAIRPYALGKFRDLLQATARHPAMLFYLDNWLNVDPNSPLAMKANAKNKKIGINENYAREVMELHTLGVNGGYTQQDVTTLAHVLTGWGLSEGKEITDKSVFFFDSRRHDYGNKALLGYDIRGGGEGEIEQVLDMLAQHPSTAKHIAYELAQYFVADEPPPSLVNKLAAAFQSSGGDMVTVLRTLFHSSEFWDPQYAQNKFKPPFRYVVSTLKANGIAPPGDTKYLQGVIGQMGEPLYRCLTPNGYSNTNDQWLNSDALLKRIDYSKKLTGLVKLDTSETIMDSLGHNWSANTLNTVQSSDPKMKSVLLLSSPEFVYY